MIKYLLVLVLLTIIFMVGIQIFVNLRLKEKWKLFKIIMFALSCATASTALLILIVVLF